MGFSLTAAAAIIGVAILIAAEIIIGSIPPKFEDVNDSYYNMKNRLIEQTQTSINITGVTTTINGANHNISIIIENTGSVVLNTSYFNILINGTNKNFNSSKPYIYLKNTAYFNLTDLEGNAGPRRIKVVTKNGISDYYEYTL